MKTIENSSDVSALNNGLSQFISTTSPWLDSTWNPEQIGWIFILDDDDYDSARNLNITPHIKDTPLTIDLDEYDLFEGNPIHDPASDYWNLVGIVGQEYGFVVFIKDSLARQLPNLKRRLQTEL